VWSSNVTVDFRARLLLGGSGVGLLLLWLLELLGWLGRRRKGLEPAVSRRTLAAWWVPPSMAALLVALTLAGTPFRLRFELSESSLTECAERIRTGVAKEDAVRGSHVGFFRIESAERKDGRVYLVTGSGFLESGGLVYSPRGPPPTSDFPWKHGPHLGGPWWVLSREY
jgi:hypothetical protein